MVNIVLRLCHNWIVDEHTVKGGSQQKWISAMVLRNYYLFVTKRGQKENFNFHYWPQMEPK